MIVRHFTEQLIVDQSLDCHLIERNLYKVFLSICDDKRITEKAVQMEEKKGKEFLFHNLQKFAIIRALWIRCSMNRMSRGMCCF